MHACVVRGVHIHCLRTYPPSYLPISTNVTLYPKYRLMALELISKLDSLAETHGCVYDALVPILDTCMTPENTRERICISIRLSICEFKSARIEYPEVCNNLDKSEKCTQLLESKPTWWTTFSGNYRQIPIICQEFRPSYESHKLIAAFRDSVDIFTQYQNELQKIINTAASSSDMFAAVWKGGILNVRTEMDAWFNEVIEKRAVEKEYLQSLSSQYSSALQHFHTEFEMADTSFTNVLERANMLTSEFHLFSNSLKDIQHKQEENVEFLNQEILSSTSLLARQTKVLSSIVDYFKPIKYVLNVISVFATPICILLASTVIVLILKRIFIRKRALKHTWSGGKQQSTEPVPDYLFY